MASSRGSHPPPGGRMEQQRHYTGRGRKQYIFPEFKEIMPALRMFLSNPQESSHVQIDLTNDNGLILMGEEKQVQKVKKQVLAFNEQLIRADHNISELHKQLLDLKEAQQYILDVLQEVRCFCLFKGYSVQIIAQSDQDIEKAKKLLDASIHECSVPDNAEDELMELLMNFNGKILEVTQGDEKKVVYTDDLMKNVSEAFGKKTKGTADEADEDELKIRSTNITNDWSGKRMTLHMTDAREQNRETQRPSSGYRDDGRKEKDSGQETYGGNGAAARKIYVDKQMAAYRGQQRGGSSSLPEEEEVLYIDGNVAHYMSHKMKQELSHTFGARLSFEGGVISIKGHLSQQEFYSVNDHLQRLACSVHTTEKYISCPTAPRCLMGPDMKETIDNIRQDGYDIRVEPIKTCRLLHTIPLSGLTINIYHGSVINVRADTVICPITNSWEPSGLSAQHIFAQGGHTIEKILRSNMAKAKFPVWSLNMIHHRIQNTEYRTLTIMAVSDWYSLPQDKDENMEKRFLFALCKVDENNHSHLAIPLEMGCRIPPAQVAAVLLQSVIKLLSINTGSTKTLKTISLCLSDLRYLETVMKIFDPFTTSEHGVRGFYQIDQHQETQDLEVHLVEDQLLNVKVNAIVATANHTLDLNKGRVSSMIKEHGGAEIEAECKKKQPKGICPTEIVVVGSGNLVNCELIILGNLPSTKTRKDYKKCFKKLLENIFKAAKEISFNSLALPAIGAGALKYPMRFCATEILRSIFIHAEDSGVHTVKIVLPTPNDEFYSLFWKYQDEQRVINEDLTKDEQIYESTSGNLVVTISEVDRFGHFADVVIVQLDSKKLGPNDLYDSNVVVAGKSGALHPWLDNKLFVENNSNITESYKTAFKWTEEAQLVTLDWRQAQFRGDRHPMESVSTVIEIFQKTLPKQAFLLQQKINIIVPATIKDKIFQTAYEKPRSVAEKVSNYIPGFKHEELVWKEFTKKGKKLTLNGVNMILTSQKAETLKQMEGRITKEFLEFEKQMFEKYKPEVPDRTYKSDDKETDMDQAYQQHQICLNVDQSGSDRSDQGGQPKSPGRRPKTGSASNLSDNSKTSNPSAAADNRRRNNGAKRRKGRQLGNFSSMTPDHSLPANQPVDDLSTRSTRSNSMIQKAHNASVPTSLARQCSSFKAGNNLKVTVYKGDILKVNVDCIVNVTPAGGNADSDNITRQAGEDVLQERQNIASYESLDVTGCIATSAGRLNFKKLIHLRALEWEGKEEKAREALFDALKNCLMVADRLAMKSIGIPALSTGEYAIPKEICAQEYCRGIDDFEDDKPNSIEEIHIIFPTDDMVETVSEVFQSRFKSVQSEPASPVRQQRRTEEVRPAQTDRRRINVMKTATSETTDPWSFEVHGLQIKRRKGRQLGNFSSMTPDHSLPANQPVDDLSTRSTRSNLMIQKAHNASVPTSLARQCSSFKAGNNLKVTVYKGDILKVNVDCIVNVTPAGGNADSDNITRQAGEDVLQERQNIASYESLDVTGCIATSAGRLNFKKLIHLRALEWEGKEEKSREALFDALKNCLMVADRLAMKSIGIPALSTGEYAIPKEICAQEYCRGIDDFEDDKPNSIEEIHIIFPTDDMVETVSEVFQSRFKSVQSEPASPVRQQRRTEEVRPAQTDRRRINVMKTATSETTDPWSFEVHRLQIKRRKGRQLGNFSSMTPDHSLPANQPVDDLSTRSTRSNSMIQKANNASVPTSLARQCSSFKAGNNLKVTVYKGDILKVNVDCIVNVTPAGGNADSDNITRQAGEDVLQERQNIASYESLDVTGCIATSAGRLNFKKLIHLRALEWEGKEEKAREALFDALKNCLMVADRLAMKSIGIPALSTGEYAIPKEICAQEYCRGIDDFEDDKPNSIEEIHIIFPTDDMVETVSEVFQSRFKSVQSEPASPVRQQRRTEEVRPAQTDRRRINVMKTATSETTDPWSFEVHGLQIKRRKGRQLGNFSSMTPDHSLPANQPVDDLSTRSTRSNLMIQKAHNASVPTSLARQCSSFKAGNNLKVTVYKGDILKVNVDCIVNVTPAGGNADSDNITRQAGEDVLQERQNIASYESLDVTGCIATSAGRLNFKKLIHLRALEWEGKEEKSREALFDALKNCLMVADRLAMKSIGIPALSTGEYAIPKEICAQEYCRGIDDFEDDKPNSIEEIHIIFPTDDMVETVSEVFQSRFKSVQSEPASPVRQQRRTEEVRPAQTDRRRINVMKTATSETTDPWSFEVHGLQIKRRKGRQLGNFSSMTPDHSLPANQPVDDLSTRSTRSNSMIQKAHNVSIPTSLARQCSCFKAGNNLKVTVYKGDILEVNVDCIVNVTPAGGNADSDNITRQAGENVLQERQNIASYESLDETGCIATSAGRLNFKKLIHLRALEWEGKEEKSREALFDALENCLMVADRLAMKSIGIPALSTGDYAIPKEICAQEYSRGIDDFEDNKPNSIEEIHFIFPTDDMVSTVSEVFQSRFKIVQSEPTSPVRKQRTAEEVRPAQTDRRRINVTKTATSGTTDPGSFGVHGIQIKVYTGDILKLDVDCIVNETNESLEHGGGVARVIALAAGRDFQQESYRYIRKNGYLNITDCIATSAGNLKYRNVLHAVGPRWRSAREVDRTRRELRKTIVQCLLCVEQLGLQSVGIPSISTGIFGVPKDICAEEYGRGILEFCEQYDPKILKEVHFVDVAADIVRIVSGTFTEMFASKPAPSFTETSNAGRSLSVEQRRSADTGSDLRGPNESMQHMPNNLETKKNKHDSKTSKVTPERPTLPAGLELKKKHQEGSKQFSSTFTSFTPSPSSESEKELSFQRSVSLDETLPKKQVDGGADRRSGNDEKSHGRDVAILKPSARPFSSSGSQRRYQSPQSSRNNTLPQQNTHNSKNSASEVGDVSRTQAERGDLAPAFGSRKNPYTFFPFNHTGIVIKVYKHDISMCRVDAVVSILESHGRENSKIAQSVRKVVGPDSPKEFEVNRIKDLETIVKHVQGASFQYVIYANLPFWKNSDSFKKEMKKCIGNVFKSAKNISSIALPVLGLFGTSAAKPEECCQILADGVMSFCANLPNRHSTIHEIHLIGFDDVLVYYLKEAVNAQLDVKQQSRSQGNNSDEWKTTDRKGTALDQAHKQQNRVMMIPSNNLENCRKFQTPEGITIYVYQHSILAIETDCIVSTANSSMEPVGKIAKTIADAAGPRYISECKEYLSANRYLRPGHARVTTAGDLERFGYQCVIHTVGPGQRDYDDDVQAASDCLHKAVYSCLLEAGQEQCRSIGIPSISAGNHGMPKKVCATQYCMGVLNYSATKQESTVKEIHFVDVKQEMVEIVQLMFASFLEGDANAEK